MNILGIDIGSVSISIALIDHNNAIIQHSYLPHEGTIKKSLIEELKNYQLPDISAIAVTDSVPKIFKQAQVFDSRISFITATQQFFDKIGSILIVGGEKFGLATFDEQGRYTNYRANTACAAGTGSFLDQQAKRLNISNISQFSEFALSNKGDFPKIASRCAVFAKTDLIHAQQEGYTKQEIADGLSYGLAKNLVDTLFSGYELREPVIFVGGVSKNKAVKKHIDKLLGTELITHEYGHIFGAVGAAFLLNERIKNGENIDFKQILLPDELFVEEPEKKNYFYKKLELKLSDYPDFSSLEKFDFQSKRFPETVPVETDIYENIDNKNINVFLGIDIGSTSTKATITDENKNVLVGLYTRTSGQPVIATQTIFETIVDIQEKHKVKFNIKGFGTTGSGRKFIGKIFGADLILDEISAHARAAYELDPEVDTIIEIGGQDSKFTTIRNGLVTFSIMNNVCAAGTGSFIEEQAKKLNVPLSKYADMASDVPAPFASDRCTVFMERDLNQYLRKGYSKNEILAAVLHSIRENYLSKVAIESNIGKKIFFQGATARNKALVAAFEQRLRKPIMVSKFCHLTGALGVSLEMIDNQQVKPFKTKFKGLDLYQKDIPVRTEICELCTNHCKLKVAEIDGEVEAYGFLCGRDYNVQKFVNNNTSGFDLLKEYKKTSAFKPKNTKKSTVTIGLPAGLYMHEELSKWRKFFDLLGLKTITSMPVKSPVKRGKNIASAEFCAPIAAMHAHVEYLADKADFIFLPTYLEKKTNNKEIRREYCYYTQFLPPIITSNLAFKKIKFITPVIYSLQSNYTMKMHLHSALKNAGLNGFSLLDVNNAYDKAQKFYENQLKNWQNIFKKHSKDKNELKVVLLGRPYTILSQKMNSGIPDLFAKNGIKTFFTDMLEVSDNDTKEIQYLLENIKWNYAAKILAAAEKIANTPDLYPVFVTSYKCSPDSFALEYFKTIMDIHKKPYLILQLDEHDSSVGYETRIEAAIRSFQNHFKLQKQEKQDNLLCNDSNIITNSKLLKGKTLLIPDWDNYVSPLLTATLKNGGYGAIALTDTQQSIQQSSVINSGQCIPLSVIIQNTLNTIIDNKLPTDNLVVWMIKSSLACNFSMYPFFLKKVLKEKAHLYKGLDKVQVYLGDISFIDISFNVATNAYFSYMAGGYLKKIACKIRPYEVNKGETNAVIKKSLELLEYVIENGESKEKALRKIINDLKAIPVNRTERPKVAIFGDLYVRDNDIMNQNLIEFIEQNGGEVITTPYSEYLKLIAHPYLQRRFKEGYYFDAATIKLIELLIPLIEKKYFKYFNEILQEEPVNITESFKEKLELFNIKPLHFGESFDNALKILHIAEKNKDLSFFVQANPAYCAAAIITESMAQKVEELTGIPVVTIEYDATSDRKNTDLIPYLRFATKQIAEKSMITIK